MFKIGQVYEITMWVTGAAGGMHQAHAGTVVEIAMPLVKFRDESGAEAIVNTSSVAFVGAKLLDERDA